MNKPLAWTSEQIDKFMTYGPCVECGAPREPRVIVNGEVQEKGDSRNGMYVGRLVESQLVCENGHRQG